MPDSPPLPSSPAASAKPLGAVTLVALGINGIVGVGIFVAPPQVAAAFPGGLGALLYLAIALGCVPVALTYARLARAMPIDGGPALYASRAFGPRATAPIGALVWVSAVFSTAAVTRALGDVLAAHLHRPQLAAPIALATTALLAWTNLRGLRPSALLWTTLTFLKLVPLFAIASLGLFLTPNSAPSASASSASGVVGRAALAVLFAMQGFEIVPLPAGQVRDAERTVPRATLASLLLAGVLYAAVHAACAKALPALASSADPIPESAKVLGGAPLAAAVGFGVLCSIAGITVGMHAMTPRYLAALAKDPAESPAATRTVLITAGLVAPMVTFSKLPQLVDLSSVAVLAQYAAAALALGWLGIKRREGLTARDGWPALPSLIVVAVLLSQAAARELGFALAIAVTSALAAERLRRGGGVRA